MGKVFRYAFVILIMTIIFIFSSHTASESTNVSDSLIIQISKFLNLNIEITNAITFIVRKSAHFILYLILGIAVINLIITYSNKTINIILISILICFIYSITDEIHQTFVIGRSGEIRDIFIDTVGSTFGILIYKLFRRS